MGRSRAGLTFQRENVERTARTAYQVIGKVLKVIPVSRRLLLIIWPFLGIVVVLSWLSIESMSILSATRAYAEGESLWSKAQKQSVFQLLRYAQTRDVSPLRELPQR